MIRTNTKGRHRLNLSFGHAPILRRPLWPRLGEQRVVLEGAEGDVVARVQADEAPSRPVVQHVALQAHAFEQVARVAPHDVTPIGSKRRLL